MLAAPRKLRERLVTKSQSAIFFRPKEEVFLLRDNTAFASGVICIVVWSCLTASSREPSACIKRP